MAELQIQVIDKYRRSASLSARSDRRFMRLALEGTRRKVLKGERDSDQLECFEAELVMINRIHELSEQLAIVALYRVVELSYGSVVRFALREKQVPDWTSSVGERRKRVKSLFNFDMSDVVYNAAADELRLLNNAIKHHNKVTGELARYAGWTEGRQLPLLSSAYERLAPMTPKHVEDFAARVFRSRPTNFRLQAPVGGTAAVDEHRRRSPRAPEPGP